MAYFKPFFALNKKAWKDSYIRLPNKSLKQSKNKAK
jgi:spore germination protein AA